MLVEKNLKEALEYYIKGKPVTALWMGEDGSMNAMLLSDILDQPENHFLVDVPAVVNPDFEQAVQDMVEPDQNENDAEGDEQLPPPDQPEKKLEKEIDEKMLGFPQYSGDKAWVINGQSVSAYTKGFYEKFDHVWNIRNIGKVYWHKRKLVCRSIDTQYIKVDAAKRLERTGKPDEKGTGNELGEILDYCFFEHVLGAPKILSKYEQVTAGGTYKAQSSGVHLLTIGDEKLPAYQLVYGASGIVDDIQDAIDRAFEEIASVSSGQRKERQVVDSIVMGKSFDEDTTARLKNVLLPSKVKIPVDNAYGLFIGYTLGLDADQYDNDSFRTAVQDKMRLDIQHHVQYIVDKINTLRLGKSSFYIYVLPLNDALSDKKEIMDRLLGGDE